MSLRVGAAEAREGAEGARGRAASRDPLFRPWAAAAVGEPVLVATVDGEPSYWTVPIELDQHVIGFVHVTGEGKVAATGALYRDPSDLSGCPVVVTGVTAADALRVAANAAGLRDDLVEPPLYVHDGPPGREAWLVRVTGDGMPRQFFVTAGGVEERPAGSG